MAEFKAAGKKRGSQLRLIVDKACVVDLAFLCDTTGSMQVIDFYVIPVMQSSPLQMSSRLVPAGLYQHGED